MHTFAYRPGGPPCGSSCRSEWNRRRYALLRQAAADLDLDLARSYMVGDKWSDMVVAAQVGASLHERSDERTTWRNGYRPRTWDTRAGSILLARRVENPSQDTLGILPLTVRRNAYGRQNESFIADFELRLPGQPPVTQEGVFIRAPRVTEWDDGVQVLGEHEGWPAALQWGRHLVTTFHPELSEDGHLHSYFIGLCQDKAVLRVSG